MQSFPKEVENELLSIFQSGKLDEAEKFALSNIKVFPEHLLSWKILGVIHLQRGLFKKSIKINKKIIEINPSDAEGYCYLGSSYKLLGQSSKAIKYFLKAINLREDYSDAILNLANSQAELQRFEDAELNFKKFISLNPKNSNAIFQLGIILDKMERFEEASEAYLSAYKLNQKSLDILFNLATSLMKAEKYEQSLKFYELYNSINPTESKSFFNMGVIHHILQNKKLAIKYYKQSIELNPKSSKAHHKLGFLLTEFFYVDDAEKHYLEAIKIDSSNMDALVDLSSLYFLVGKKDEAEKLLNKAEALNENDPGLIILSLKAKKIKSHAPLFKKAHKAFHNKDNKLKKLQRASLAFSIAESYERSDDFEKAFDYYVSANAIKRSLKHYSIKDDILEFKRLKKNYKFIEDFKPKISSSLNHRIPIFILGMPRSGTSLVEQIISSHRDVYGGGELVFFNRCFDEFIRNSEQLNPKDLLGIRDCYLEKIGQLSDSRFITDKMPQNFRFIGFILNAIPEAKIVYLSRDPGAVCWGNFKQNFNVNGPKYSNDLEHIVDYYKLHEDLMSFWTESCGKEIIMCNYEKLTTNPESEIKKLLKKLDLDWDENCLSPEKNSRHVFTASNQQVRNKIYKNSSKSWEQFKPYIGNLFDRLY